ncbi:unnamed protein product [Bursaphelenchus xylophilus]|uniref:(pine wood nematode) hypothetical protein n=1 Tax=Bursaphelenchus xylophilus TaxID=6326 RepID=A0A7I8WMQ2_BURXY|nr:unnamed protein product [Bursaphelenchus xylophilus]CAG9092303.1 unnamed protein product [Bursaphelenchus xylophilus]
MTTEAAETSVESAETLHTEHTPQPEALEEGDPEKKTIFTVFDKNNDGTISVNQLGSALRGLGLCPTEKELGEIMEQWKDQPDARLTFDEFVPIFEQLENTRVANTKDEFLDGLQHFDSDGTGLIKTSQLKHILTTLGEKLTEQEVDQLLEGLGDENGMLNIDDFVQLITQ